jgi:DNA polymerase-3 subunit alpha
MQTLYLATHFNSIYWNTACLIVNSGSNIIGENEQTDYAKIAKAIGDILEQNVEVSLLDINKSDFSFKPDAKNNKILFGLKGAVNVSDDLIIEIINGRPYASMEDFYYKIKPKRQAMISLIKGGAFDQFEERKKTMVKYIWMTCDKKKDLNMRNLPMLLKNNLIPINSDESLSFANKIYEFNRYLKAECEKDMNSYKLDTRSLNFLINFLSREDLIENSIYLNIKKWNKAYQDYMNIIRDWLSENKNELLEKLNINIFMEDWNKYGKGSLSAWEMDVLCFYKHDHELSKVNFSKYGISNFNNLPLDPVVEKTFKKGKNKIPIFKLAKICGTCIAKDKNRSIVYILTPFSGIVAIKFRKEYFSLFDRQISEKQLNGTKKRIEASWFNKGSMIVVQGIRRENEFIAKKYASSGGHQLYHIDEVFENGDLTLRHERKVGISEEED